MENFKINVPIKNTVEDSEESSENENPAVINVDSITVPAFKKEFHYSESIQKETSIEGYERLKISWGALYDYVKNSFTEMPNADNEEEKRESVITMSQISSFTIRLNDTYSFLEREVGLAGKTDSFRSSIEKIMKLCDVYSKIINSNVEASSIILEIKTLYANLQQTSDELLEFRALLQKIGTLNKIINSAQERFMNAVMSLLSTWSDDEFPRLTLNHVLSADVMSSEHVIEHKEKLFKDGIFIQKIVGYDFDLSDGYFWDWNYSIFSQPSFGFALNDPTLIKSTSSFNDETAEFIRDPNAKQWLSQVNNPEHGRGKESGYSNWYESSKFKYRHPGHPRLSLYNNSGIEKHPLRWGHAKYAIIPTEKNLNLIKLKHTDEE